MIRKANNIIIDIYFTHLFHCFDKIIVWHENVTLCSYIELNFIILHLVAEL